MKLIKNRYVVIGLLYVLLLLLSVVLTFAYYVTEKEYGITLSTGDIEITAYIKFDDLAIDEQSIYYDSLKDVLIVNTYDLDSLNYIGKLDVRITVRASLASRLRVKLMDEWELTRTYKEDNRETVETIYHTNKESSYYPFSLLKLGADFTPVFESDGYAYEQSILAQGEEKEIHLVDGGDHYSVRNNVFFEESCILKLSFVIDVIQANRYVELWGLSRDFYNE